MRGKGFASQWMYGPVKAVKLPAWLEDEVRVYCHKRELARLRGEICSLKGEIALHVVELPPGVPRSKSHEKKLGQAQARASKKRR